MTTIKSLKHALGNGMGSRKNNYLLEIPFLGIDSHSLNILCQSASLPMRNITTYDLFHKGRKYSVRGETDYGSEYPITVLDDDKLTLRKSLDYWLEKVDKSAPSSVVGDITAAINGVSNLAGSLADGDIGYINGILSNSKGSKYQTSVNIWQLNGNGEKVYGYKMENVFIKSIGEVTYSDSAQNELVEYPVTLQYSEFKPIYNNMLGSLESFVDA